MTTDIVASGPLYESHSIQGNKLTVSFDYAAGGLQLNGSTGFEIAGADGVFVAADATVVDDQVKVSSTSITQPMYVRYAWKDYIEATLFNKEGLPASSFSTED